MADHRPGLKVATDMILDGYPPMLAYCKACGSEYTHQQGVAVFDRAEDDPTHITAVGRGALELAAAGNPSARRQAVSIVMRCEACEHVWYLDILQHKGQTFVCHRERGTEYHG